MTRSLTAVYPGTFDPITLGHLDIVRRATTLCDHLVIGVARNDDKGPLFPTADRVAMVEGEVAPLVADGHRVSVQPFEGLLMHFAQASGARVIIRGLRAVSDFEYEFQMAGMNTRLDPGVETVFLMASEQLQFVSSRLIKEIAKLGGDIRPFVSPAVAERLTERFRD